MVTAPLFRFGDASHVTTGDATTRSQAPLGQLSLAGPSPRVEAGHLAVRGDLAHIKLAGQFFVPHYAVPMPHRLIVAGTLRQGASHDAAAVCALEAQAVFEVLDIAGGWAWGQVADEDEGFVGYLDMPSLSAIEA